MNLDNLCKHCGNRIFNDIKPEHRHYNAPSIVRVAWKDKIGSFPLGPFYKAKCEVCKKKMAIFDRPRGELKGQIIVLYECTFSDKPADDDCDSYKSCVFIKYKSCYC